MRRKWHIFKSKYKGWTVISAHHNGLATLRKIANRQFGSCIAGVCAIIIATNANMGIAFCVTEIVIQTMYSRRYETVCFYIPNI